MNELRDMLSDLDVMYMRLLRLQKQIEETTFPVVYQKLNAESIAYQAGSAIANAHGAVEDLHTRLESCGIEL